MNRTMHLALALGCLTPVSCLDGADLDDPATESTSSSRGITRASVDPMRRKLAAAIRSPITTGATETLPAWCPPEVGSPACGACTGADECYTELGKCGHHRPWLGQWATDVFTDNQADACGTDAYLRVSPSALPGGLEPERVSARVAETGLACGSGILARGGRRQSYVLRAHYRGQVYELGKMLVAHLDNLVYTDGDIIDDITDARIGTIWTTNQNQCVHDNQASCLADQCSWNPNNSTCYNGCWGGCHLHIEFWNYEPNTWSCWQNMCNDANLLMTPVWGTQSIIGYVGGSGSAGVCERYTQSEDRPCSTWDHDWSGCDQHGWFDPKANDTQDCAYYVTSDLCRPRGTPNCQAGIPASCGGGEAGACSAWDGDVGGCDIHGLTDPNPGNDTQDCAYYFLSAKCLPRGTSNCAADCDSCIGSGCATCSTQCPKSQPQPSAALFSIEGGVTPTPEPIPGPPPDPSF